MRTLLRLLLLLAGAGLVAAGTLLWARGELYRPADNTQPADFNVPAGASLRSALQLASKAAVLRYPRVLEWYARWRTPGAGPKAGHYRVDAHATPLQLLEQLQQGRVVLEQLTVVEGWTFAQMRRELAGNAALAHDWAPLSEAEIMQRLGQVGQKAEGRFFPDSYRFAAGTSDAEIYQQAWQRMERELAAAWQARDPTLPLHTAGELLIFASIVERETGREDERGKVAAVFANRLQKGMRLQSDPTVIYGLGARYDGDIRSRDLSTDTPYNTYTRSGLPPTPIALPGAAALRAAARPDSSTALYFVASGSGDGRHVFSDTLAQHSAAVKRLVARTRRRN
jgi:UPF0755 protein